MLLLLLLLMILILVQEQGWGTLARVDGDFTQGVVGKFVVCTHAPPTYSARQPTT